MADYTGSPSGMFGRIEQNGQTGLLGGYLQSIANEFGYDQQVDAKKERDLAFLENMRKYKMAQENDDVTRATNKNKIEDATLNSKLSAEGIPESLARSAASLALDKNDTAMQENQMIRLKNAGEFLVDMRDSTKNTKWGADNLDEWNDWRAKAQKVGVNLPYAPDERTLAMINSKADAYLKNPEFQRKSIALGEQAGYNQELERIRSEGRIDAAIQRALNTERTNNPPDPRKKYMNQIIEKAQSTGEISETEYNAVKAFEAPTILNKYDDLAKKVQDSTLTELRVKNKEDLAAWKKKNGYPDDFSVDDIAKAERVKYLDQRLNEQATALTFGAKVTGKNTPAATKPIDKEVPQPQATPPKSPQSSSGPIRPADAPVAWTGKGEPGKVYMTPKGPGRYIGLDPQGKPQFQKV